MQLSSHDPNGGPQGTSPRPIWQPALADELRDFARQLLDQSCSGAMVDDYNNGLCLIRLNFGERIKRDSPDSKCQPERRPTQSYWEVRSLENLCAVAGARAYGRQSLSDLHGF